MLFAADGQQPLGQAGPTCLGHLWQFVPLVPVLTSCHAVVQERRAATRSLQPTVCTSGASRVTCRLQNGLVLLAPTRPCQHSCGRPSHTSGSYSCCATRSQGGCAPLVTGSSHRGAADCQQAAASVPCWHAHLVVGCIYLTFSLPLVRVLWRLNTWQTWAAAFLTSMESAPCCRHAVAVQA